MRHRHVQRGFYKRGFDVVGGLAGLKEGVLRKLRARAGARGAAGASGAPVRMRGRREARRAQSAFANWGFNVVASHRVSHHRAVPDARSPACRRRDFSAEIDGNMNASVVIVFHNEAW